MDKYYNENISIREMLNILKTKENTILLDVRSKMEYERGHLANSINIPLDEIEESDIEFRIKDKSTPIIAYCSVGRRSKIAIRILRKMGYKNLYTIEGGIGKYE